MMNKVFSKFKHYTNSDYAFRDLSVATTDSEKLEIEEGISFGDFSSVQAGLFLIEREAPTPSEKAITDSVPYQQGEYDFSLLDGQRYFNNRELTYKFIAYDDDYHYRGGLEHEIKRQLMPYGVKELHDSHIPGYVWRAKCTEVSVEDSAENGLLTVTIKFDAYPYAVAENDEGSDVWDDVNFDHWISQYVDFDVNGDRDVSIINIGSTFVECSFELNGEIKLSSPSIDEVELKQDNYQTTQIVLQPGDNQIHLSGNGHIKFVFKREEMM